jgi:hypothetical protein
MLNLKSVFSGADLPHNVQRNCSLDMRVPMMFGSGVGEEITILSALSPWQDGQGKPTCTE